MYLNKSKFTAFPLLSQQGVFLFTLSYSDRYFNVRRQFKSLVNIEPLITETSHYADTQNIHTLFHNLYKI